jgi:hypothetical protein
MHVDYFTALSLRGQGMPEAERAWTIVQEARNRP